MQSHGHPGNAMADQRLVHGPNISGLGRTRAVFAGSDTMHRKESSAQAAVKVQRPLPLKGNGQCKFTRGHNGSPPPHSTNVLGKQTMLGHEHNLSSCTRHRQSSDCKHGQFSMKGRSGGIACAHTCLSHTNTTCPRTTIASHPNQVLGHQTKHNCASHNLLRAAETLASLLIPFLLPAANTCIFPHLKRS